MADEMVSLQLTLDAVIEMNNVLAESKFAIHRVDPEVYKALIIEVINLKLKQKTTIN